jgi:hypothetical protein
MFGLPLAFTAPLVLSGLVLLPVLWWLLRVTPPRPQRIAFPPLAIARDLIPERQTPSNTPWWLLLLRLLIAALVILAAAGPVLSPQPQGESAERPGPVVLLLDNGFSAARDWPERMALAEARIASAGREGQGAAIVGLAELPGEIAIGAPQAALERLRALPLRPHAAERAAHLPSLDVALSRWPAARVVWISDGVSIQDTGLPANSAASPFTERMRALGAAGRLVIHADAPATLALSSAENQNQALNVKVLRPHGSGAGDGIIRAQDARGLPLGEAPFVFGPTATETIARLQMPIELRNAVSRIEIEGERSAGAVHLVDERGKRRRIGVVTAATADTAQPLLSPVYYVTRALSPFAELREPASGATDPIGALLSQNLSMLVLADVAAFDRETTEKLNGFVERGGVIIRFAGPRLAAGGDALSPVRLRRGGRSLGGALSWDAPKRLAPFTRQSPFDGLTTPDEVRVTRQILAEPDADLPGKVWAALEDGTPVVTAERRGQGLIVLFHITADTTWSNLPLSGLFVDMLRRIVTLAGAPSEATTEARIERAAPVRVLDGAGIWRAPPPTAQPVLRGATARASLVHPPGFYGAGEALTAINTLGENDVLSPLPLSSLSAPVLPIARSAARDLRAPLFVAALLLLLADSLLTLLLAGKLGSGRTGGGTGLRRPAAAAIALAGAGLLLVASPSVEAQTAPAPATPPAAAPASPPAPVPKALIDAAKSTRLAYVVTGDRAVDEMSRAGLDGLTQAMALRTALEAGEPVGLDPARDELALFPLIYWPVIGGKPTPAPEVIRKLDAYMKGGGLVIFDTRDALTARPGGPPTPEGLALRRMLATLDVPELEPVPRDHVLTKTFYLVDGFVGRHANGQTWTETLPPVAEDGRRPARAGDSVSPLIITSNDLASAWAVGRRGEALVPMSGSNPRQREMALRGGVNIVMYALTGNYKADQVHVPALLERLGQ